MALGDASKSRGTFSTGPGATRGGEGAQVLFEGVVTGRPEVRKWSPGTGAFQIVITKTRMRSLRYDIPVIKPLAG